jgi:protein disulfide-isomerase A6
VLTEANFEQTVLGSQDVWFVEFYAPWCGHCKHLEPEWNAVATAMKGSKVKFGKVDATVESSLAGRFGVNGYPTIKYWGYGGDKSVGNAETYQSTRTAEALQAFANDLLEKANIDPEIRELVGQKVFDENCEGAKICLMLFVPNIYDSNANERNNYISQLLEVAKRNRKQPVVFFWLAAGDQLDLERKLNLGSGYPTVIAVSRTKGVFATMLSSFSQQNIHEFITKVLTGSASV